MSTEAIFSALAWIGAAGFAVVTLIDAQRIRRRESARRTLTQFVEVFPGRCPLCAYHRFGIRHGLCSPDDPRLKHDCIEPRPTDESKGGSSDD